jgi:predicted ATPase
LFADVEGSTRLLNELGDAYAEVLAEYRRVLRDAFARHDGFEVDTQGDAFFVAFERASDALAAAREATDSLVDPVRVRVGLHTGEPLLTDEGYVGIDVHRAARIAAAGHGGQILVSQSTRDLVGGDGLRDLGEHRLKDLTARERLYQLGEGDFPPLKSLNRTNLPVAATPLVGRARELAELTELLRNGVRLLTVTGPGGTGKTRLALQVAAELLGEFPDGVFFAAFGAMRDSQLVVPTIAHAAGVRERADLRDVSALVVVDNLEHLLSAAPDLSAVLSEAPQLKLLATSRAPLHIGGEHEYPLEPFPENDAVAFFLERARAVNATIEASNVVSEICRRLDGLALALELAAPRLKVVDPAQLLRRLDHRLPILTGGARDAPDRHRTLRATIDWSHELLNDREQGVFRCLAVFPGTFSVEAAVPVAGADLDDLTALVDWSLLKPIGNGRFFMLETIREYATERLELAGDADQVRERHAAYFVALADEVDARIRGPEQYALVDVLDLEHDNMRAALRWYVLRDADSALRLALALEHFWAIRGHLHEADGWFKAALAAPGSAPGDRRAHAMRQAGHVAWGVGDDARARGLHEQSLSLAIAANSKVDIAHALIVLGRTDEGMRLFEELGDDRRTASALHYLGGAAMLEQDWPRARELFGRTVELYRRCAIPADLANAVHSLADCALEEGRLDDAARHYRESLEIFSRLGSKDGVAFCLGGIASLAAKRGDHPIAGRLWRAVEEAEQALGRPLWEPDRRRYERALASSVVPQEAPPQPTAVREALAYVD